MKEMLQTCYKSWGSGLPNHPTPLQEQGSPIGRSSITPWASLWDPGSPSVTPSVSLSSFPSPGTVSLPSRPEEGQFFRSQAVAYSIASDLPPGLPPDENVWISVSLLSVSCETGFCCVVQADSCYILERALIYSVPSTRKGPSSLLSPQLKESSLKSFSLLAGPPLALNPSTWVLTPVG